MKSKPWWGREKRKRRHWWIHAVPDSCQRSKSIRSQKNKKPPSSLPMQSRSRWMALWRRATTASIVPREGKRPKRADVWLVLETTWGPYAKARLKEEGKDGEGKEKGTAKEVSEAVLEIIVTDRFRYIIR